MAADKVERASVKATARGSRLDALARRHTAPLRRYFERRVSNREDVPDLVQDVLMRLARLEDLSTLEQPEHYLFRTASSALRDQLRKDATHHRRAHVAFDAEAHGGSDFSPERVLAGRQALAAVHATLRTLPERTRDIFVLRMFEEQKTAEVAAAIGISTRAVESHYARALAAVAIALRSHRDD
ncbi:RNA polymerase sigma factor [Sphingosinicella rhizophila]|uniref:Sigma-70 family RNA polymerase sigma factor n=1 Tax=Sphingosinicella rhizophila TaxID=3050082 RepID=A0ABU3QBK7_9SPHN|nr:sigma-70 family RNA polymerase sigma factor [Sphingosinicella sp. GR2756]MDT9600662.1 sigma-70 family RNA polymerase sigma factor [Sphingosinicella sp. GR2756]